MKICIDLKERDSDLFFSGDGQSLLHGTLLESVRSFLRSPKRNIEELKQCIEMTETIPEIATSSKLELKDAIVSCVSTVKQSQMEVLKELILRKGLFTTEKTQLYLIKSFTSLRLPRLHSLLFDILMDAQFSEASSKAETVWFRDCFDNAILHIKREENEEKKLEYVYKYLAKAQKICTLRHSELASYLDKIGIESVRP